ncbi:26S proteasome regulatory subunit 10B [Hondaea fermentalgiana]|uniref:26S proteasome regulatory subunit 10B n=1 Tax=Hondaea fermentalgiana TaxID=2315210 RepID=A0A2R5G900_9STRA|nr:26S proteasome regulatory subunit 10B [Hondaea fermentalgiana]|eukprot:GBG27480.1 26S proteasome regulatory subunit 10B [Hondaea fermentalgiana]
MEATVEARVARTSASGGGALLVTGPRGVGKTYVVRAALEAAQANATLRGDPVHVDLAGARERAAQASGGAGAFEEDHALRDALDEALGGEGRAVVVDDADLWFSPKADARLVLTLVQALRDAAGRVIVLIAPRPDDLHALVCKAAPERIEIPVPSPEERLVIWRGTLAQYPPLSEPEPDKDTVDSLIRDVNARCHGWVAGDIVDLCHGVERLEDLAASVDAYVPGLFRADAGADAPFTVVSADRVSTSWDDIGGLEATKQALQEMIVWPTVYSETFSSLGVAPPGGVLLYGPPGTGKTLLASAVAKETNASLLSVSISDVVRGHVGESERMIAAIFAMARRAAPCVLFFDEFQAMFGSRASSGELGRKMIAQFLQETDIHVPGLVIMASTNVPEAIDPALLRPGRFDRRLHVPLPDKVGRETILRRRQATMRSWGPDVDVEVLVGATEGWSGAELVSLCDRAALEALRRNEKKITAQDFRVVLATASVAVA